MNKRVVLVASVLVIAIALVFVLRQSFKSVDDQTLTKMLVGTWRARDVENGALNHRKGGVEKEEVIVGGDGTLRYVVVPKPGQGDPAEDHYSWKVSKGKLRLRLVGPSGVQDELPSIPISIDQSTLSLRRRGYSTKVFDRVSS